MRIYRNVNRVEQLNEFTFIPLKGRKCEKSRQNIA